MSIIHIETRKIRKNEDTEKSNIDSFDIIIYTFTCPGFWFGFMVNDEKSVGFGLWFLFFFSAKVS